MSMVGKNVTRKTDTGTLFPMLVVDQTCDGRLWCQYFYRGLPYYAIEERKDLELMSQDIPTDQPTWAASRDPAQIKRQRQTLKNHLEKAGALPQQSRNTPCPSRAPCPEP